MLQRHCACCGELFIARRNIPNQKYCGSKQCQRSRRSRWQKEKLLKDEHYREYQEKARKRWRESNPDYMRNYRESHPQYRERERKRRAISRSCSIVENERVRLAPTAERAVKMDEWAPQHVGKSGIYKISPYGGNAVKMNEYIAQITVIKGDTATAFSP